MIGLNAYFIQIGGTVMLRQKFRLILMHLQLVLRLLTSFFF